MDGIDRGLDIPVVRLSVASEPGRAVASAYGVRRVPTLLVLDEAGRAVFQQAGSIVPDPVRDAVAGLLASKPIDTEVE